MVERLSRLYALLQTMKARRNGSEQARWFLRHELSKDLDGPFEATEIAYQIYIGDVGFRDWVVNAETHQTFQIGAHRFLWRWAEESQEVERRLRRGLTRCIRARANQLELPEKAVRRLLGQDLTEAQERAFSILEIDPSSPIDQIRRRHRALARCNHPDRGGNPERMKEINWAFDVVRSSGSLEGRI